MKWLTSGLLPRLRETKCGQKGLGLDSPLAYHAIVDNMASVVFLSRNAQVFDRAIISDIKCGGSQHCLCP